MIRAFKRLIPFVQKRRSISEDELEDIEEILLQADIGVSVSDEIIASVSQNRDSASVYDILSAHLRDALLESSFLPLQDRPDVMVFFGVNGTGKTTSIGKTAAFLRKRVGDIGIVLAAGDTFRAAAREQLEIHAQNTRTRLIAQDRYADPAAVVFDAISSAKAQDDYVVLVDTAGRMHTNTSLIEELKKIERVVTKLEVQKRNIFVLDANTGYNALSQIEEFHKAVGIDAILLTKIDSAASGGVLVPVAKQFGIPCIGLGNGEGYDDLEEFKISSFVALMLQDLRDV